MEYSRSYGIYGFALQPVWLQRLENTVYWDHLHQRMFIPNIKFSGTTAQNAKGGLHELRSTKDGEMMKSIVEIDDVTLKSFRWPSCQEPDGRYTSCRYLADFILKDQDGVWIADMFVARKKESSSYSAEGTLLARPGSNEASIYNVVIPFIAYSIDFSEVGSSQRGYWMESNIKGRRVFYKLVRPHIDYRVQSDNMECKLHKFLELYDYLASLKHLLNKKGFIECNMTIHELHKSSNEAFDLNFVKENGTLLLLNLVNSLQELKCALLIDSVRELAELDRKAIFKFFPSVSQRAYDKALADGRAKSIREAAPSTKDQLVTEEDTELAIPVLKKKRGRPSQQN